MKLRYSAALVAVLLSPDAFAQQQSDAAVTQMDMNRDGKVTSNEVDAQQQQQFSQADANGDGQLDKQEQRTFSRLITNQNMRRGRMDEPQQTGSGWEKQGYEGDQAPPQSPGSMR